MDKRYVLLYYAVKHTGDFETMVAAIKTKEEINKEELNLFIDRYEGRFITILDEKYPQKLSELYRPPLVLFYKGNIDLLDDKTKKYVAFVGSRHASQESRDNTFAAAKGVSDSKNIVVSGLAKGIDTSAALGALESGLFIGVVGSGLDMYYPKENKHLQDAVGEKCLLITEYPDGIGPSGSHFPERNRIVVGLSQVVVVGEGRDKSGTIISTVLAIEHNRMLAAFPTAPNKEIINNRLIHDGAYLVQDANDILDLFNPTKQIY